MSSNIDAAIDALKEKLASKRLSPDQLLAASQKFFEQVKEKLQSSRLAFELDEEDENGPSIDIFYEDGQFHIGEVWIQPDGSVAFHSESQDYFPQTAFFENEEEFFKEAQIFMVEGLAAFEMDEEDDAYEV